MTHPDGGDLYCLTSVSQRTLQCQFIKSYWQSCQDGGQVSTNQSLVVEHVTSNHKVIDWTGEPLNPREMRQISAAATRKFILMNLPNIDCCKM